jgi:hypothetical protein
MSKSFGYAFAVVVLGSWFGFFFMGMEYQKGVVKKENQSRVTVHVPPTGGYSIKTPSGTELDLPSVGGMVLTLKAVETGTILDSK